MDGLIKMVTKEMEHEGGETDSKENEESTSDSEEEEKYSSEEEEEISKD